MWNVPLLISRQSMIEHGLSSWARQDDDKLNIIVTYNLLFNAALMVEAGIDYAVCLDKLVNTMDVSNFVFALWQKAWGRYGYRMEEISNILKGISRIPGKTARVVFRTIMAIRTTKRLGIIRAVLL